MAEINEENRELVERLKTLLNAGYHGGAWHGPSILEAIKNITPEEASFKTPTVHTAAELIYHITSWRIFTIKRLQGDSEYQIDNEKKNFGSAPKVDEFELETLIMELSLSHDELIREIDKIDDKFLSEIVTGSEYDYFTLINGIIHHDIYHSGQINLLKKICGAYADNDGDEISSRYFDDGMGDAF
ncbi:DinB family protein [Arcticibacterium luteifluviistationis]|uniref:DinB family protein n=1 Tax=Arcticibacterium luteifluviistationis TaxID=1784714 RepID=A0A2Z4G933_9BACT|nr:DinB family protein [Arcticibacterium luteifluviistationis]AWV97615.1 DinB family protein [Arcticibacterium luteifluviistationis]